MLKPIDISVSEPESCVFRNCAVSAEIVDDYARFCYCGVFLQYLHAIGKKRDDQAPEYNCSNNHSFPEWCPLAGCNINIWRDR